MSWLSIASIIDKFLPHREERIRSKIQALEKERDEILNKPMSARNVNRIELVLKQLRTLESKLKNR